MKGYYAYMGKGGCSYFHDGKPITAEEFFAALKRIAEQTKKAA